MDIAEVLASEQVNREIIEKWEMPVKKDLPLRQLSKKITELCSCLEKEVVLIVECRFLFLTFLKPIINGAGNYYIEVRARNQRRMDIVHTLAKFEDASLTGKKFFRL